MLRVAVLILAMLQQLMPPGMCLCIAVASAKAPAASVEIESPRGCGCCSHRKTPPVRSEPEPPPRPCLPHCVTDAQQTVLTDAVAFLPGFVPEFTVDRLIVSAAHSAFPIPQVDSSPSSPPLYVSYCALLI